jgi:diguanylate cyclase (GGDEF)-like protein
LSVSGNGQRPEGDQELPRAPGHIDLESDEQAGGEVEQTLLELDQTLSDSDQTAADVDQGASWADEAGAEADQRGADSDQHASDRDQAAADRDQSSAPAASSQRAFEASRVQRAEASSERAATAVTRSETSLARSREAMTRDETARLRDLSAMARDRAAEARDRAAERHAQSIPNGGPPSKTIRALQQSVAALRAQAAADRARAAADRKKAAADRQKAAADRVQARLDLQRAQIDDLTGVPTRSRGKLTLQHEIDRAHRSGEPFVLAFIDVNGLKDVNDREGHAAGDALLRAVAVAIQANLRSYDPIVRVGGDEFVCGFTNTQLAPATRRVKEIQDALNHSQPAGSISVGLAALRPGDTLKDLTARADADLYQHKHRNQPAAPPTPLMGAATIRGGRGRR